MEEIRLEDYQEVLREAKRQTNKISNKKNYRLNKHIYAEQAAINRRKTRLQILNHYGHFCVCCGVTEYEFLCIDHVNNDGAEHRSRFANPDLVYKDIINMGFPDDFQILCWNCNSAKFFSGTCPHQHAKTS